MIRRLIAIIRVDFFLEFAYPLSLLFFIVLPLVFTAAVGAGLGGLGGDAATPEEYRTRIYIIDHDQGPLVDNLVDALKAANLDPVMVEHMPEDSFGLEIPAGFSQNLLSSGTASVRLHTLPTVTASQAVEQYVQGAISRLGGAALVAEMGLVQAREAGIVTDEAEAQAFFNEILSDTLAASQDPAVVSVVQWAGKGEADPSPRDTPTSAEQASAGQIVTWVQITLLGAAEVLVSERLGGTMRRLLVTPARRATILGGKLLARLILGLVQMGILFIGGALLFGVAWGQDPLALLVVSLAFALAMIGLGMFLATLVKTSGQANSVVIGLAMGLAALGGAWYPLEITPPLYQQVVQVLPSTWAMRAYTDLLVRQASLMEVLPAVGVLLLFAVVFIVLGVLRFRRYEQ